MPVDSEKSAAKHKAMEKAFTFLLQLPIKRRKKGLCKSMC